MQSTQSMTENEIATQVVDAALCVDLFINNKIIVEIKAVDALHEIHLAQVLSYLKLSKLQLGLLINFNVTKIKDGIKRVVNGL